MVARLASDSPRRDSQSARYCFFFNFNHNWNVGKISVKVSNIKIYKNSVQVFELLHADRQT